MGNFNKELAAMASENGLNYDDQSGTVFGRKNGYEVMVNRIENNMTTISISASRNGEAPDNAELKLFVKNNKKVLANYSLAHHKIMFNVMAGMSMSKRVEKVSQALNLITEFFNSNNYENCCQECGNVGITESYVVSGAPKMSCNACFAHHANEVDSNNEIAKRKKENIPAGIIGALFGALIGAVVIVVVAKLGYVAWISGVVMGVCTLKGYEILGKKLGVVGAIVSFVIMIGMTFLAYQVFQTMELVELFKTSLNTDVSFFDMFKEVMPLLKELDVAYPSEGIMTSYYTELIKFYAFTLIGAIPTAIGIMREKKLGNVTYKMSRNGIE